MFLIFHIITLNCVFVCNNKKETEKKEKREGKTNQNSMHNKNTRKNGAKKAWMISQLNQKIAENTYLIRIFESLSHQSKRHPR